jgi:Xaa-Pro aminopeptidase
VGYDPQHNTEAARLWLGDRGVDAVPVTSPIGPMKAKKTAAELVVMKAAFAKADAVVSGAAAWLSGAVLAGQRVSELDFAREVERRFLASGATGLSFRVISAAGANGAIIHYSDPSPDVVITRGEVVLLDTGAYYAEGFATDLTRTFLVGAPDDRGTEAERARYTHVLKAAIAGMTAVFPEAAKGYQLDAITRAPLWAAGLDYNHGTGHGVGINVHEFPPRIGPLSTARVEVGHVFSIEPGVYLPGVGGVRIENLCTVEPAPGRPGFLRVVPLTFSPLDARLIEASMLEPKERAFLAAHDPATARAIG